MDFFMTVMDERVKTRLRDGPPVLSAGVAAADRGQTFGILKRLFLAAAVPVYGAAGLGDGNSITPPIISMAQFSNCLQGCSLLPPDRLSAMAGRGARQGGTASDSGRDAWWRDRRSDAGNS